MAGQASCSKHLRKRQAKKRAGAYGAVYRANRDVLLRAWNADPNTTCHECGLRARVGDPWEPDHLIPFDDGGSDHISNLRPLHRSCNRRRGAQYGAAKRKAEADRRAQLRIAATYELIGRSG